MRGSARIYDVRMAQFVLKIEKLSHIMGPRASQDLRSPTSKKQPEHKAKARGYCFRKPMEHILLSIITEIKFKKVHVSSG